VQSLPEGDKVTDELPAIDGLVLHFTAAAVCQGCADYLMQRSEAAPPECATWRSWRLSKVSTIAWSVGHDGEDCSRCGGKALNAAAPAKLEEHVGG
jgi:hypothetical protein